jgi:hypothetical protein
MIAAAIAGSFSSRSSTVTNSFLTARENVDTLAGRSKVRMAICSSMSTRKAGISVTVRRRALTNAR